MKLINVFSLLVILATYIALFVDASSTELTAFPGVTYLDVVFLAFILVFCLQAAVTPKVLDLEEQFSFYSSYHDHVVNKLIHLVMIWPIVWTALIIFSNTASMPLPHASPYLPNALPWGPTALSLLFAGYFILLDPKSGPFSAALSVLCLLTAQLFREAKGDHAVFIAGMLHGAAWVGQFIGHGLFERRAPSLLNNLAQSFLMAPHFVFLEALFMVGLRRDLHERTRPKVVQRIKELNAGKVA